MNEMLALGFLVGLQHALEADHLMAMPRSRAAAARSGLLRAATWRGAWDTRRRCSRWAGRRCCSAACCRLAATLEFAVGLMLVLLVGARRYERRARPERAGRLRERGAGSLGDVLRRPRRTPGLRSGWWFEVTPTGSKADR